MFFLTFPNHDTSNNYIGETFTNLAGDSVVSISVIIECLLPRKKSVVQQQTDKMQNSMEVTEFINRPRA